MAERHPFDLHCKQYLTPTGIRRLGSTLRFIFVYRETVYRRSISSNSRLLKFTRMRASVRMIGAPNNVIGFNALDSFSYEAGIFTDSLNAEICTSYFRFT